ncbi:MAG: DNA repair ATPase [Actinomycetota bacterium]
MTDSPGAATGAGSQPGPTPDAAEGEGDDALGGVTRSTYDLLRRRLDDAAASLADRAGELNERRLAEFGSSTLATTATERVRTESAVVPRDVAAVGNQLILAYNAPNRVTGQVHPEDVFAVHHVTIDDGGLTISPNPNGLRGSVLDDPQFRADFDHLFTYYKSARVQQLYRNGDLLLAVFRTAAGSSDVTVMRWEIGADEQLRYLDDKGQRDHVFLANSELEWRRATRADNLDGEHFLLLDRVLVSPRRGQVRILIDDGSAEHELLLAEPVEREQTLEDCELSCAVADHLVLLRLRPYAETEHRYYVVNLLINGATRLDALGAAFRLLPEGQGLIFPEGVYLVTGELRRFDLDPAGMELQEIVVSPNGEDVLYVFHEVEGGRSILLAYNVVAQEVTSPIWCHGHCLFDDGRMVVFREEARPVKVHPVQMWETPFCSPEYHADLPREAGPLSRIGNADLVAGISDALALRRIVRDVTPSVETYAEVIAQAGRVLDANQHWLSSPDVGDLATPVRAVREVAEEIIGQFEHVQQVRAASAATLAEAADDLEQLLTRHRLEPPGTAADFITALAELRVQTGHLITLRDRREIDLDALDELAARANANSDDLAARAAAHLATEGSFDHYVERLTVLEADLDGVDSSADAAALLDGVDEVANDLDVVTTTVGDLEVDDLTVRTAVLEQVSNVAAGLNRIRSRVEGRYRALIEREHGAAFTAELGLIGQSLSTLLARADDPEACDDVLAQLLGQLEALETSAPRTENQLDELAARRSQVEETVGAQRQRLVEDRQRRADQLASAAARNVEQLARRAIEMDSIDEIAGFFAADPAANRTGRLIEQLRSLGEPVRADEIDGAVGKARDDAIRALRDRQELFDGDLVKLGEHGFSVDGRARNLTITPVGGPDGDRLEAVLTGTDLRLGLDDPELDRHRDRWHDPLPSETPTLYRAVYLAGDMLSTRRAEVDRARSTNDPAAALLELVHTEIADRLDEGYDRGVHDHDAAAILGAMAASLAEASLAADAAADDPEAADVVAAALPTASSVKAAAILAWHRAGETTRQRWGARGAAAGRVDALTDDQHRELVSGLGDALDVERAAAEYLLSEIRASSDGTPRFGADPRVLELRAELLGRPGVVDAHKLLATDAAGTGDRPAADVDGLLAVLRGVVTAAAAEEGVEHLAPELLVAVIRGDEPYRPVPVLPEVVVDDLNGQHLTIDGSRFTGRVGEILAQVAEHKDRVMPSHRAFTSARRRAAEALTDQLRLDDLEPRVPEGFVRNRLISSVYLPLIGQNLARQIGTAGDASGQRSGLLMLLSPPGYGKTTLVDYLADRLGMALVKISGPGLGHDVTSLDPERAPNAAARREVERINLSFAVGTNVILHVDDIQHTNPELLQRFISLCDAQRRIEGVWNGEPTTFDLRGKRFAVVMAGNPYTESGERFRIPDMLANRADTWNLGDVVGSNEEAFALSYLENALTANAVTAPLAGRDRNDLASLLRAADGEPLDTSTLAHAYAPAEIDDLVSTLTHLRSIQETVLAVNRRYIASAATDADARTEPPFLLQGSYRNMARMAARVVPAMTAAEVAGVIDDHYGAEAQALTGDAESNLLQLAEIRGTMTDAEAVRLAEILEAFRRRQRLGGSDDPTIIAAELVATSIDRLSGRGPGSGVPTGD